MLKKAGATTAAVAFPFTLNTVPSAAEIVLNFTNAPTVTTGKVPFISPVSTTGFTVNVETTPTVAALTFSWVLTAYKTTLVNAQSPFNVGATPGDAIRGSMTYETAT